MHLQPVSNYNYSNKKWNNHNFKGSANTEVLKQNVAELENALKAAKEKLKFQRKLDNLRTINIRNIENLIGRIKNYLTEHGGSTDSYTRQTCSMYRRTLADAEKTLDDLKNGADLFLYIETYDDYVFRTETVEDGIRKLSPMAHKYGFYGQLNADVLDY